ncbi:hypothetical protein [Novosphingobium naphthalenivorans]|uniref:hypothetical protein n=1 Tax=Novosphingobium naphthalenivorans TaxID=273168 RepID=UPI0008303957|nr:hypothetical protein [Novosphingobium naphthalenivorans]
MRDTAAAVILPAGPILDLFSSLMRLLFSHWTVFVDFTAMNWIYATRQNGRNRIPILEVLIISTIMLILGCALLEHILNFFFFIHFRPKSIFILFYPVFLVATLICGLSIAFYALHNKFANSAATISINIIVIAALLFIAFDKTISNDANTLLLIVLFAPLVLSLLFLTMLMRARKKYKFTKAVNLRSVSIYTLGFMQSVMQQTPTLIAHHFALSSIGWASALYIIERVFTLVPLTLLSVIISHYLDDFSAALLRDDVCEARKLYRNTLKHNLLIGIPILLAILVSLLVFDFLFHPAIFQSLGGMLSLTLLMSMVALGCAGWLIESVALRSLSVWRKEHISLSASISAVLGSLLLFEVLRGLHLADNWRIVALGALWAAPLLLRCVMMVGILRFFFDLHDRSAKVAVNVYR